MRRSQSIDEEWDIIISPRKKLLDFNVKEILKYRDLLYLFVRRDFVSIYKQTILGPFWFFIQPILTTLTFTIVFGRIAKLSTDGMPPILFYLAGVTMWTYFSEILRKVSTTFVTNRSVFGKVYFPRLITPLSMTLVQLFKLGIQLLLYLAFYFYYFLDDDSPLNPNIWLLSLPLLVLIASMLGLGLGLIITAFTTKYRDLTFLIGFGIQLLMYSTPVIYPLSVIPEGSRSKVLLNPMSSVIETFKFAFTGKGIVDVNWLIYSGLVSLAILIFGMLVFNRTEKSFIDTV
jgi:lipopolysaccharide transport system permease protein